MTGSNIILQLDIKEGFCPFTEFSKSLVFHYCPVISKQTTMSSDTTFDPYPNVFGRTFDQERSTNQTLKPRCLQNELSISEHFAFV